MYVYRVGYKAQIESIFNHGYSRQFLGDNEGTDYGNGVYCNIDISDSLNRLRNTPKGCIFKCEILNGLNRYLIFNEKYAKETYGAKYTIKDQVYQLFPKHVADDVWNDFSEIMRRSVSAREHMRGRTAELLQCLLSPRRGATKRAKYEKLFTQYNIRGAIYRGLKDGLCLVAYNFSECIPVSYSLDGGRTFIKKEFKGDKVDVQKTYSLSYKKVDYPVNVKTDDGQEFGFSRVLKNNGKFNYIEIESGEEISPIDFDSCTLISNDAINGKFRLEYNGNFYKACVYGFYDNNGVAHDFEELDSITDNNDMNFDDLTFESVNVGKFENILTEAFNKAIKELGIITENNFDEVKYLDYEIPTEKELDSNNTVSIYHVTNSDVVDNIFKFEFDREFNCKNGNVYGEGVYATISVRDSRHLLGSYGDAMLQLKLIGGFDRFIILDESLARKFYGRNYRIKDQLYQLLPHHLADELYNKCGNSVRAYSKIGGEYNIRGAIYPWGGLTAVLPFDFSSVIPYAVSFNGGKSFTKRFNQDVMDRVLSSVAVVYRFGHKYKDIRKAIKGYNLDGDITGYSMVQKHNGKFNYIDIQTGEEISPIDFDSCTLMDPETGMFQVEYNGEFIHNACLDGFYDEQGEEHTFDELPEFVEKIKNDKQSMSIFNDMDDF